MADTPAFTPVHTENELRDVKVPPIFCGIDIHALVLLTLFFHYVSS